MKAYKLLSLDYIIIGLKSLLTAQPNYLRYLFSIHSPCMETRFSTANNISRPSTLVFLLKITDRSFCYASLCSSSSSSSLFA